MQSKLRRHGLAVLAAAAMAMATGAPAQNTTCPGSCNNDQRVTAAELTRMVAVVLLCGGAPSGCPQVAGGCPAGDVNGDGSITVDEIVLVINNILRYDTGCPPPPATFTPTNTLPPTATHTPTVTSTPSHTPQITDTPTRTAPPSDTPTPAPTATATATAAPTDTSTPVPSPSPTVTSTPTSTSTPLPAVCGNGVIEGDEECDDGGICTGGDNAGTACTSEADCVGNGVCVGGEKFSTACASDADCPGSRCVRCRPFGGDGCAANCTFERKVRGDFFFRAGSSAVVMVEGDIPLTVPLDGSQVLTYGKPGPDGVIPVVIKEAESVIRRTTLAGVCVCVRPVPAKTCGGTLFEADGVTRSLDCSFQDTCAANNKPPCSFLHGPGNSTSGFIGCQGLSPANMNWVQDAGGNPPPPPPTPIPGSGPPIVTFFGDGPPGSGIFVSTTRIGTASGGCTQPSPSPGVTPTPLWGPNREFCDDDDPEYARGVPNSIPLLTGQSSIVITNFYRTSTGRIETLPSTGPATITGAPFNCERLLAPTPSVIGAAIAGGFTALNQPQFGSLVTTNKFAYATATFTRTPTITPTGPTRTPTRTPRR